MNDPHQPGEHAADPVNELASALQSRYAGLTAGEARTAADGLLRKLAADLRSGKSAATVFTRPDGAIDLWKFDITGSDDPGTPQEAGRPAGVRGWAADLTRRAAPGRK